MVNFNKGGKSFGGGKKFGGGGDRGGKRSFGGGRDRGRAEMHKAVCSDCKNECEVPFRPTGDKPVFCSNCFKNDEKNKKVNSRFNSKRPYQGGGGSDSSGYKFQFEVLNSKLDKILGLLSLESVGVDKHNLKKNFINKKGR